MAKSVKRSSFQLTHAVYMAAKEAGLDCGRIVKTVSEEQKEMQNDGATKTLGDFTIKGSETAGRFAAVNETVKTEFVGKLSLAMALAIVNDAIGSAEKKAAKAGVSLGFRLIVDEKSTIGQWLMGHKAEVAKKPEANTVKA